MITEAFHGLVLSLQIGLLKIRDMHKKGQASGYGDEMQEGKNRWSREKNEKKTKRKLL